MSGNHPPLGSRCWKNSLVAGIFTEDDLISVFTSTTLASTLSSWCRIGRVEAFRPEGSDPRSSRHVGTLGKS